MQSVAGSSEQNWTAQHAAQLASIGLPQSLHHRLAYKLSRQIFDQGSAVAFNWVSYLEGGEGWAVIANHPIDREEDVWLSDHIWLYPDLVIAKAQLAQCEELKSRLVLLLGLEGSEAADEELLLSKVTPLASQIRFNNGDRSEHCLHYVNDEFGSRIEHTDSAANVNTAALFDYASGATYTIVWPVQRIEKGERLLRAVDTSPVNLFWGKGYWQQRFEHEDTYDWYCSWPDLEQLVIDTLTERAAVADELVTLIPGNGSSPLPVQLWEAVQHLHVRILAADYVTDLAERMAAKYPQPDVQWLTEDLTLEGQLWKSLYETGVDLILDKGCMDAFLVKPVELRIDDADHWLTHEDEAADAIGYLSHCAKALRCRSGSMIIVTLTRRGLTEPLLRRVGLSVLSWERLQLENASLQQPNIVRVVGDANATQKIQSSLE